MNAKKVIILLVTLLAAENCLAQGLRGSVGVGSTTSMYSIKLHGTVTLGNGFGQALISINGGEQYYIRRDDELVKNVILKKVYTRYVLLKTSVGIKSLTITSSAISETEANYDPNLKEGQSRTFYKPPVD